MIWFEYKFNTPMEIMSSVNKISNFSILDYIIIFFIVVLFIWLLYYIFPSLNILSEYRNKQKEKIKRNNMIEKMKYSKEIDAEIEKELDL
jgi:hypothetical protein